MITGSLILFNLKQRTEECMRTAKIGSDLRLLLLNYYYTSFWKGAFLC